MGRLHFILPLAFCLVLLPHATLAFRVWSLRTFAKAPTTQPPNPLHVTSAFKVWSLRTFAKAPTTQPPNPLHVTSAFKVWSLRTFAKAPTTQPKGPNDKKAPNPLIEKACASAVNKKFCIDTLKAQPSSANADLKTLAFISLNVTKAYGSNVATWVATKLEEPQASPSIEQGLTDCVEQYTDALAQLEDSMVAFFSNAYKDINTWMTTAVNNANTCEAGLKEEKVGSVMGNMNQVFAQYCNNALAVVNALAKQQ